MAIESKVIQSISRSETERLARELVRIPSYTTEETPLAEFIYGYMVSIGLEAELQPVDLEGGTRSHNVVGRIPGTGKAPSLLFTGHMDHAPALGRAYDDLTGWKRDPFAGVIEGDWLYGKGSQDEKGGLCAMLVAAKAIVEAGGRPPGDLYFAPVQGHKRVSSGTRRLLQSGLTFEYAVNTENSGNSIVPTWVGRAEARIRVRARAGGRELHFHFKEVDPSIRAHRSVFEQTRRVLDELGAEMAPPSDATWMAFAHHDGLPGYPQFRIEKLTTRSQMVVDIDLQIRTVPGQTEETLRHDLQGCLERLGQSDGTFEAELMFPTAPIRSAVHVPDEDPLVRALAAAYEQVAGEQPIVSAQGRLGAAADASVLVEHGVKTVIFGPGGGVSDVAYQAAIHRREVPPDERISLPDIVMAARVYAGTAMALRPVT